jgi:hypothetical protein
VNDALGISLFLVYVLLLIVRPRVGAVFAAVVFAWLGWQEGMRGCAAGVVHAAMCGVMYVGMPLAVAHSPSTTRTRKA